MSLQGIPSVGRSHALRVPATFPSAGDRRWRPGPRAITPSRAVDVIPLSNSQDVSIQGASLTLTHAAADQLDQVLAGGQGRLCGGGRFGKRFVRGGGSVGALGLR